MTSLCANEKLPLVLTLGFSPTLKFLLKTIFVHEVILIISNFLMDINSFELNPSPLYTLYCKQHNKVNSKAPKIHHVSNLKS